MKTVKVKDDDSAYVAEMKDLLNAYLKRKNSTLIDVWDDRKTEGDGKGYMALVKTKKGRRKIIVYWEFGTDPVWAPLD